jgi:hypothetical protein
MKNNIKAMVLTCILIIAILTGCNNFLSSQVETTVESSSVTAALAKQNIKIPTDEEILQMFDTAKTMAWDAGIFIHTDEGLREKTTGETIEEYIDKYRIVFTDKYVINYFNLVGYNGNHSCLELSMPAAGQVWFDYKGYYVYFEDITNESNYTGYDTVIIGGYGTRGSDMSYMSNQIEIIEKTSDRILIRNTIQHWHIDMDAQYVCHVENNKIIIDGAYGGYNDETKLPIILEDSRVGEEISRADGYQYWLSTSYDYNLVYENGDWKFDDFVLWG